VHVIGDAERPLEPAFIYTAAVDIDALDEIPGIVVALQYILDSEEKKDET